VANASRLPAHSRHRCTDQAVGAPQRSQSGAATGGSRARQAGHSCVPPTPQRRQRCGSSRSSTSPTLVGRMWRRGHSSPARRPATW